MPQDLFSESGSVSLGVRVRLLREVEGLTKESLAKKAGVLELAVTFLERDEFHKVTIAEAHQIVHNLNLAPFGGTIQELRKLINGMDLTTWEPEHFPAVSSSARRFVRS